mmetsp:Transcript_49346/g.111990  ORF Transcript_49346/g.111990 Transcript_49346/m.111990 type:complete len:210 (+) Transcript_49346:893-1522(+)
MEGGDWDRSFGQRDDGHWHVLSRCPGLDPHHLDERVVAVGLCLFLGKVSERGVGEVGHSERLGDAEGLGVGGEEHELVYGRPRAPRRAHEVEHEVGHARVHGHGHDHVALRRLLQHRLELLLDLDRAAQEAVQRTAVEFERVRARRVSVVPPVGPRQARHQLPRLLRDGLLLRVHVRVAALQEPADVVRCALAGVGAVHVGDGHAVLVV